MALLQGPIKTVTEKPVTSDRFIRRCLPAPVLMVLVVLCCAPLMAQENVRESTPVVVASSTGAAARSTVTIERLSSEELASSRAGASSAPVNTDAYVDKLIDPNATAAPLSGMYGRGRDSESAIYHSINAAAYYRDNYLDDGDTLDTGIEYLAFMPTNNYGDLRLNLVVLDEEANSFFRQPDSALPGSVSNRKQEGLRRYSLEQLGLPVSSDLSMDNIIGTHRQSRNVPFRSRVTVVNQRFGASEPDIRGLTTRLYSRNNGVSISTGKIGDTSGTVLPGFVKTEGTVNRVLGHHLADDYKLSADLWNTSDFDNGDLNRVGGRVNWENIWSDSLESTASIAASDDSMAVLFGLSQFLPSGFSHDGGLYYFEPEFIWIDTQIGDDYIGAFYRFNHSYRTFYYSATLEQRRDGYDGDKKRKRDTSYVSLNGNYRLDRNSIVSASYTLRDIKDLSDQDLDVSSTEHTFRGTYSLQHGRNTRSNIATTYREREGDSLQRVTYGLVRDLQDDSSAELRLEYDREDGEVFNSDRYRVELAWQKYFLSRGTLALGAGYNYGEDQIADDTGWNGYINYDLSIGRNWSISTQLDYNRAEYGTEEGLFSDDLFTDNQFIEQDRLVAEEFSALLNVRYSFGGNQESGILARNGATRGSGRILGRLFLDANGDGVAQPDEKGLEGVTVYLDSIYPLTTNARGEFEYPAVGPGDHYIFVDESVLPLPWTLNGNEYAPLTVALRDTTRIDIPVAKLNVRGIR